MSINVNVNNVLDRFSTESADIAVRNKPLDTSQSYAAVITDNMLDSLHGSGAAIQLRKPNSAGYMPVKELQSEIEKLSAQPDVIQDLKRLAEGGVEKDSVKKFDVGNLNISLIADLLARLFESAQRGAIAEKMNKASMLTLQGDAANGVANAMRNAGLDALKGASGQAVLGLGVAGASFGMQRKGLNQDRTILQNDQKTIHLKQHDLESSRLKMTQGETKPLENTLDARPSRVSTDDGQHVQFAQDNPAVSKSHRGHNEEGIGLHTRQAEVNELEREMKDKSLTAENNKNMGTLAGQASAPIQSIMSANTQHNVRNEEANQHLQQQAGQAFAGGRIAVIALPAIPITWCCLFCKN
ncbi:IpaC/SipC family type III secretion system effector [Acerihabitans sp. KWT182]|uniref:IpaC/SipC family type III secretion system effector n=1 Tax=Acerihabitans sp. KWT182 TaxID=3157919 RepID=A0AAU7QBL4_9GAMM